MSYLYKNFYDYPITKDELWSFKYMTDSAINNYLLSKNYQMIIIKLFQQF